MLRLWAALLNALGLSECAFAAASASSTIPPQPSPAIGQVMFPASGCGVYFTRESKAGMLWLVSMQ